jgi:hypothetical protein
MLTLARTLVALALLSAFGCAGSQPSPTPPSAAEPSTVEPSVGGSFTLVADGSTTPVRLDFAPPSGHVFCRWYAEAERGDYVWIRLAQTSEQDGDAGPRLDIDVCRLTAGGSARYTPTPAGAHGSHCAAEPGFAIWWHEGESAFNSGTTAQPDRCWLELELDEAAGTLAGKFACEPLDAAPHSDASASETPPSGSVHVSAGQFECTLERMPVE